MDDVLKTHNLRHFIIETVQNELQRLGLVPSTTAAYVQGGVGSASAERFATELDWADAIIDAKQPRPGHDLAGEVKVFRREFNSAIEQRDEIRAYLASVHPSWATSGKSIIDGIKDLAQRADAERLGDVMRQQLNRTNETLERTLEQNVRQLEEIHAYLAQVNPEAEHSEHSLLDLIRVHIERADKHGETVRQISALFTETQAPDETPRTLVETVEKMVRERSQLAMIATNLRQHVARCMKVDRLALDVSKHPLTRIDHE